MKLNKKGFVLAETLVVAVFMATIFTIIYVNFYPLIGEYEKREFYDDLDSKYDIYWFKRLVQNKHALSTDNWRTYTGKEYNAACDDDSNGYCDTDNSTIRSNRYVEITCGIFESNSVDGIDYYKLCNELRNKTGITRLYLTTYYLGNPASGSGGQQLMYEGQTRYFKDEINNFDENFKDYVFYLPDFRYASPNGARFRLLAQFERHTHRGHSDDIKYYSYATIEVNREKGV